MLARIYQPARNAMQSGDGKSDVWILEFAPQARKTIDPLMGWTSSSDMRSQVKMRFESKDAAIEYASRNGLSYEMAEPKKRRRRPRGYGENFSVSRRQSWTH